MPTPWKATPEQERDQELMAETQFVSPTFTGYITWRMMEEWREKQDDKPLRRDTTLSAAVNKWPWQWVDAACKLYGLPTQGQRKNKAAKLVARLTDSDRLREAVRDLSIEQRLVLQRVVRARRKGKGRASSRRLFLACS